jgi:predicted porin
LKTPTRSFVAALLATAFTLPAAAQSSVQITGIADAAARQVSNQGRGSVKSLVSGSNATSRIVVRGSEDLGGGLSASFWLEHGLALDTGLPTGGFWDRRSTLSLASKTAGEVRLGRDYVPTYLNWVRFDPFSHVGAAGSNNSVSATPLGPIRSAFGSTANTTVRASDTLQYLLPTGLGGLEGQVMLGAGEGSGNKVVAGRLGYTAGPLYLSAARTVTENTNTASGKFTDIAVGGTWNLGWVRASAVWRQFKQNASKQTNLLLAGVVPVSTGEVKLSLIRVDLDGRVGATSIDANGATQLGLGYVHNLSKRSALYGTYARISNRGAATYQVPGGPAGLAGGARSTGYELGMRHSF